MRIPLEKLSCFFKSLNVNSEIPGPAASASGMPGSACLNTALFSTEDAPLPALFWASVCRRLTFTSVRRGSFEVFADASLTAPTHPVMSVKGARFPAERQQRASGQVKFAAKLSKQAEPL